ncbi:MAG TPA: tetratricopeptide repeat protein, partial [Thermoanaerobaculia bacterium]|nr:tetratricopeptide repeat protein [Thermoanaerobaculia bacterium]
KVLDFGLARFLVREGLETETTWSRDPAAGAAGEVAGTMGYMSPEQLLGQAVDTRSDIFSLGALVYEMLAGARAFTGSSAAAVIDAVLHGEPPPVPFAADPRLPATETLVRRMLAKDAAARPASLREVLQTLEELASGPGAPSASAPAEPLAAAVAVLVFANLTRDPADDWIAGALAETAAAAFDRVEGLRVLSRERVAEAQSDIGAAGAAGPEAPIALGRRLGARWLVRGAFQRQGDAVRATAELLDAASGVVVRAVKADGLLSAIFALEDQLAEELSSGLRMKLAAVQEEDSTEVVAAYEALRKGLLNLGADNYESLERAILLFERALALDPRYVRAHLELGVAYAQKAGHLVAPELYERALAPLRRAIELRPRHPRAWRELGATYIAMGREEEGLEALHRAEALAPEDPLVLGGLGRAQFIGRADFAAAAAYFERAVEANPEAGWYWLQLAHCAALLRQFERGERAARRGWVLQEAFLSGQQGVMIIGSAMRLGHLAALQQRTAEAVEHLQRELAFLSHVDHALRSRITIELHMRLGAAKLQLGHTEEGEAELATALSAFGERVRLGSDDPFTRYYAAAAHALRGEAAEALSALEKAAAARRAFVVARARIEPEWDGLRDDPRFQRLLAGS